jgi:hypothetical protein
VIVDSVRLPAESFVGDQVELRYTVRTQATPTIGEELPTPAWGDLNAVRAIPVSAGFDLRLTVTPYETGTLTVPPLDLGEIRIEGLSFVVLSILGPGDSALRGLEGPQLLPGTGSSAVTMSLVLAILITLFLYGIGPGRSHLRLIMRWYRARVPYKELLSCVHMLEQDIKRYSMRDFYITLMAALQTFLDSRLERNCLAATSTELVEMLPELEATCGAVAGTAMSLEEVIRAADSVKFAGMTIRRKKRLRHLVVVRAVAVELETHRRRLRRTRKAELETAEVGSVGI